MIFTTARLMQFIIEKDLFKACRKTNGEPFLLMQIINF